MDFNLDYTLDNPNVYDVATNDYFGRGVAIDGIYAIVGAQNEDDSSGTESGKVYIFNITTGSLVRTLNNPNAYGTSYQDYFGFKVDISGDYAIVGVGYEDDSGGIGSGKAYIFNVTTGSLVHTLDNPNAYGTSNGDNFGESVAIDGNYAIVGANEEDDPGYTDSGKAYIFNVTTGSLVHTLDNPNAYGTSMNDTFGYSVAISGNYAIVGAPQEDDSGYTESGKAYIFNVTTGELIYTLDNPNAYGTSAGDNFGLKVAISDSYAIVGAYYEADANGTESGKAYIFSLSTGELVYTLDNPNAYDTSTNDRFGCSLDIDGNYAVVGAYFENDANYSASGIAYVFSVNSGELIDTINNPSAYGTSEADYFGYSVSISGTNIIIGAFLEDDSGGSASGKAYIFSGDYNIDLRWIINNPNVYNTGAGDNFGYSIAVDGSNVLVGAYLEDENAGLGSGKAYIFDINTGNLVHTLNNPNAYSTSASDQFGWSVAISGNYAIVGANAEDDSGGGGSGKAYIFNVATGELVYTLDNPNAYGTSANDNFGQSVAIDGNYAVVTANAEDDSGGTESGKAYIFNVTTGSLVRTLNNPNAYGTSADDNFGRSVAVSGNYAVVNAYFEDDSSGTESGKVYIFNITTGSLVRTLNNPNAYGTSADDQFGRSIAIDGNYIVIGTPFEDDALYTYSGKVYTFDLNTGNLIHTFSDPNAYGTSYDDRFGFSVAIDGNYIVIGAPYEDDSTYAESGKVYIFSLDTGSLLYTLNNPNAYGTSYMDYFGYNVAIDINNIIIGTHYEDDISGDYSGKVYIFTITSHQYLVLDVEQSGSSIILTYSWEVI